MRLLENRKYLAIIIVLIILSSTSIVLVIIIVNTPGNNSQEQDTILPNVIILSPIQDSTVSGTILIEMNATDTNGISSYAIYINGVFRSGTISYSWDTIQESNGIHTILCEATDPSGNTGSNSISVTVENGGGADTTPPIVTIISPLGNSIVSGIVTITTIATDANGISSYAIYINDILRSGTNIYSWNTTQEMDGSHAILCEAIDPSGNNGSDTISVIVNNSVIFQEPSEIFKLMTFNIKESGEDLGYPDWKTVVQEENADIIMFIETGNWDDNSNTKLNQYVNEFNTYFSDEDPYIGYCTQGISFSTDGAALMSRYPVISYNQITHVPLDNTTSYDVTHDFYDVEVNVSGTLIHIIGSHLKAMS
ncbi:hypothetical protein LCGC14_1087990 [marine sediment metagenome]|uniref:Uncharacterized protein n=1 Tax=marine sediment metagenome TaxID=412755 RepID=A0A0F9QJA0_9ZZZZ